MDIVVSENQSTAVVTENGDTVVTTADSTQVVSAQEQSAIVTTNPATDVVGVTGDTVLVAEPAVVILTEGAQGPAGPPGAGGSSGIQLEMGETLTKGTPVYVSANKLYAADNVTNFRVIGVLSSDAAIATPGSAVSLGQLDLLGLVSGAPYFLGNKIITQVAPSAGYVVRIGQAITGGTLSVNIEEPILLS